MPAPSFTPAQAALVRESWRAVSARSTLVTLHFYRCLFRRAPRLEALFDQTDLEAQSKKFADTLTVAVTGLDQIEWLGPAMNELGQRHRTYGVRDEHYEVVGESLIEALAIELGEDGFTPEIQDAWQTVYQTIASLMKEGSRGPNTVVPALD